ncbi:agrin-like [Episyrphus balteatus]|uniref:agrin-like n=1 Tax=Episyrphus balteatus TaxID=286459 RepID=UPI0024865259|nr:agrin-like [Episyrphus balteatus]
MSSPKIIVIFFILILCNSSKSCDITHECPTDNDVIWAINGTDCHTFRNKCFLDNVNCNHQNNKEHQLEVTSKEDCQRLCKTKCPEDDEPVCGYYNEHSQGQTFSNQCEMDAHICKTGETLFVYGVGPCEPADAKDEEEVEEPSS